MKRLNFEKKLIAWFEANRGRKFEWGKFDCALSVLEALEFVYGEKFHPPKIWTNERDALKVYAGIYSPVQSFIDNGFEIVKSVQTGDVIILRTDNKMQTICIAINNKYTVIDENEGLQLRDFGNEEYTILRK